MSMNERAEAIIRDIQDNHLPRVIEGLRAGYVDENQILVIYDHLVRVRMLKEATSAEVMQSLELLARPGMLRKGTPFLLGKLKEQLKAFNLRTHQWSDKV